MWRLLMIKRGSRHLDTFDSTEKFFRAYCSPHASRLLDLGVGGVCVTVDSSVNKERSCLDRV